MRLLLPSALWQTLSIVSAMDWEMRISRAVRLITRERVGARPVQIEGVDAIDITGLSGAPLALNHTVFVENPMVFGDMNRLMAAGERPPQKAPPPTRRSTLAQIGVVLAQEGSSAHAEIDP